MKKLSLEEVEYLSHRLAKELMNYDEPLPEFNTRFPGRLESCLEQPFQTFSGNDLYPSLVNKATLLFYLLIKNHPFENGNKRMAVAITLTFVYFNGHWITVDPNALYEIALTVAKSKADQKTVIINTLEKFFSHYMVKR